jgi:hypothetical protein
MSRWENFIKIDLKELLVAVRDVRLQALVLALPNILVILPELPHPTPSPNLLGTR